MAEFDPQTYISQKQSQFDPSVYIAQKTKQNTPPETSWTDKAQTGLENFGQAATAGYLPNLQAASEKMNIAKFLFPASDPSRVDEMLRAKGVNVQNAPEPSYVDLRDENIKRIQEESARNPGSALTGQLGGLVASAPLYGKALGLVPGLGAGAEAESVNTAGGRALQTAGNVLKNTAQAAGGGALMGAVQNPGDTEGELSSLQVPERLKNAGTGALIGGVTGAVTSGIKSASDFIFNTPERLEDWAQLKAAKSAGMMLKDYRQMNARSPSFDPESRIKEVGQARIDNGLVKPGATFDDVAEKSLDLKQKAGKIIGDTYQTAVDALSNLDPSDLTPDMRKSLVQTALTPVKWAKQLAKQFGGVLDKEGTVITPGELTGKAGGTAALSGVQSTLDELAQNGENVNIQKLQEFKAGLDDLINYNKRMGDTPLKNQYLSKIRNFVSSKIEGRIDALDNVLGSDQLGTLKQANKDYGIWSEVNRISQDRVNREAANRFASLTDTLAAGSGAGSGAVVGAMMGGDEHKLSGAIKGGAAGLGLGLVNNMARRYGNPMAVNAASSGANLLNAVPRVIPNTMNAIGGVGAVNPAVTGSVASRFFNPPKNKGLIK